MAIGDSMFNGVRSAMINDELAGSSPIAAFAKAAGIASFVRPSYPREILIDIEREARKSIPGLVSDLLSLKKIIVPNARKWLSTSGLDSRPAYHDNVACAGADYQSMMTRTGATALQEAQAALERIENSEDLAFRDVMLLWFGLNDNFVLDPSRGRKGAQISQQSQVRQVIERRPKRLFVNIGSNEGLFNFGLLGQYKESDLEIGKSGIYKSLVDGAKNLGESLAAALAGVDMVVHFNTLVRPRAVPNLAPLDDREMLLGPKPAGAYFKHYSTKVGIRNPVKPAVVQAFDKMIRAANDASFTALQNALGQAGIRAIKVDIYDDINRFDSKHWGDARAIDVGVPWKMRNLPFATGGPFNKRQGGVCGLDNMHPTAVGYAVMARALLRSAGMDEDLISVKAAFKSDSLLQKPPGDWETINVVASTIAQFLLLTLMRNR